MGNFLSVVCHCLLKDSALHTIVKSTGVTESCVCTGPKVTDPRVCTGPEVTDPRVCTSPGVTGLRVCASVI